MEAKDYIYALGIIVTFALGAWNFVQGYRATRKASFINTVTAQRVLWLEKLRIDVSSFVGLTHTWAMAASEDDAADIMKEIDRLRYIIRLRLNPRDPPDQKISELVQLIPNLTHISQRNELMAAIDDLIAATQEMLKAEWEKVKAESKDGDLKERPRIKRPQGRFNSSVNAS